MKISRGGVPDAHPSNSLNHTLSVRQRISTAKNLRSKSGETSLAELRNAAIHVLQDVPLHKRPVLICALPFLGLETFNEELLKVGIATVNTDQIIAAIDPKFIDNSNAGRLNNAQHGAMMHKVWMEVQKVLSSPAAKAKRFAVLATNLHSLSQFFKDAYGVSRFDLSIGQLPDDYIETVSEWSRAHPGSTVSESLAKSWAEGWERHGALKAMLVIALPSGVTLSELLIDAVSSLGTGGASKALEQGSVNSGSKNLADNES